MWTKNLQCIVKSKRLFFYVILADLSVLIQGSKKALSGRPGQADFLPPGQVTFKLTYPVGNGLSKWSST